MTGQTPLGLDRATSADVVIRAAAVRVFDERRQVHRGIALRDGRVLALAPDVDDLQPLIADRTVVVDAGDLTFIPGFFDTHNHMLHAGPDLDRPQLSGVRTLAELVDVVRAAAQDTPAGDWIIPSRNWHETNLAERRLPTAAELDEAATEHPVALRRGGHVMVANSRALELAGIDRDSPDPAMGTVVRDGSGAPTGVLIEPPAFEGITRLLPEADFDTRVGQLERICAQYNAVGLTAVRDPGINGDDFLVYQHVRDRGRLTVRSHVMLRLIPEWAVEEMIAEIHRWHVRSGLGDDVFRLGGIKMFLDGGVEGGALSEPYANDPDNRGHLFLDADALTEVVTAAVSRGWRIGCHAVGDRALDAALDAYARVLDRHPGLAPGHLVVEHAFFADDEQRRRAIDLGVGITVQHPLLYALAGNMVTYWGEERTEQVLPIGAWVADGALVAAGTDHNVTFYNPMLSLWGMITRQTAVAGRRGADYAVDRGTAFDLYTAAGARLLGEQERRGTLLPGRLADLCGYRTDPLTCELDDLPELTPDLTIVGGGAVHDPDGRVTAPSKGDADG